MKNCGHLCSWNTIYGCQKPDSEPCILSNMPCESFEQKPQTNADHIRSMTDEELAVALKITAKNDVCFNTQCENCGDCVFYSFCNSVRCEEDVEEWLKQPYKEEV